MLKIYNIQNEVKLKNNYNNLILFQLDFVLRKGMWLNMKKIKYLIGIIVICVIVFIGIEVFRKVENNDNKEPEENVNNTVNAELEESKTDENIAEPNKTQKPETVIEIKTGEELLEKADKILTTQGWAGASNNVVGLKDNILYYYNKATGEFLKLATGIEDIYRETEFSEEIIAKKTANTEKIAEAPNFIVYK